MKQVIFISSILLLLTSSVKAQELNCQIEIDYKQVLNTASKQIFDQMQKSIYEFMNNTKWTNDNYAPNEKIECSMLIIINKAASQEDFSGTIQITCRRPIYKSGTYTQILNIEDENFQFKFQQFTNLEFNINTFQNNLTSVLAYYAYVILATDGDSFAPLGGTQYWQKALQIVNNAQNTSETGWKSTEVGQRNRYWLAENTLQPVFKGVRDCMYDYCLNGLDHMHEGVEEARATVLKSLDKLKPVYSSRPASFVMQVFFNAKRDELINIFKGATPEEKTKVLETLMMVDPAGTTKYAKIQG